MKGESDRPEIASEYQRGVVQDAAGVECGCWNHGYE